MANADQAKWTAADGWSLPPGCGGAQYKRAVSMIRGSDRGAVRAALDAITSKNYKFSGYEEFSNEYARVHAAGGDAAVAAHYSDRVIIVDEVHSLRSDTDSKRSSELLLKALSMASNVKLLLLSATPMFDKPAEIEIGRAHV